jgi:hypothetical protein
MQRAQPAARETRRVSRQQTIQGNKVGIARRRSAGHKPAFTPGITLGRAGGIPTPAALCPPALGQAGPRGASAAEPTFFLSRPSPFGSHRTSVEGVQNWPRWDGLPPVHAFLRAVRANCHNSRYGRIAHNGEDGATIHRSPDIPHNRFLAVLNWD